MKTGDILNLTHRSKFAKLGLDYLREKEGHAAVKTQKLVALISVIDSLKTEK